MGWGEPHTPPKDQGEFSDDLEDLLGPPVGFEKVQVFRASVADVKPLINRGVIEVRFHVHSLAIDELGPLIRASGKMLEVGVAQKVWSPDAYFDPETGDYQDPIGAPP